MSVVCIDLDVYDEDQLYEKALEHAMTVDGLSQEEATELLRPAGEVDVSACLVMIFDPGSVPGVSINQSWVQL